jgi:hypothetical protein
MTGVDPQDGAIPPVFQIDQGRKEAKLARRAEKIAAADAKLQAARAQRDAKLAKKGEDPAILGPKVASEIFALKSVTIYANGYIKVRGLMGGSPAKLIAISASADVTKKSGLGRAVGAAATAGWSLATPSRRGDAYLVIITDRGTHKLSTNSPTAQDIRASRTLEAAGQAVLTGAANASQPPPPTGDPVAVSEQPKRQKSVPDQIREMKALLDEGIITQEDFDKFKAGLLS